MWLACICRWVGVGVVWGVHICFHLPPLPPVTPAPHPTTSPLPTPFQFVFKHMGADAKRLEYPDLMAYVTALLVDSAVPPCAAYHLFHMMQVVHTHPVTLAGVYRILHHLLNNSQESG